MVGYPNPAQVKSSTPAKRQVERLYRSDTCGPQPQLVAAAAAAANANANGVAAPAPLENAIQVRDGSTWFEDNILQGRNARSMTAGPSRPRGLPDPGPDERTPLDLLDEDYRPPEDYVPKYENTLTMSWDERFNTDEVQALLRVAIISGDIAEIELAIRNSRSEVDLSSLTVQQIRLRRVFAKTFNVLPWDDICDILLPSTLERLPEDAVRGGRSFEDDLLRNRIAKVGGLKKSVKPGSRCGTLDKLSYHNRRVLIEDFEKALRQLKPTAEGQARAAEKDSKLKLVRGIPGLGKIQGFGRHLDTDAGPSMPASESIENPDRAGLRYPDGIEDHPKSVDASTAQAESSSSVRINLKTGNPVKPARSSAPAGPTNRPMSVDVPLLYDPGKYGMPAGPSSDEDEPSSTAQRAKGKKKNKKKKKKSDAPSLPPAPLTLADCPYPRFPMQKSNFGHEEPVSSPLPSTRTEEAGIDRNTVGSPSDSPLPPPPSNMQHPLPPRPSFASFELASTSPTDLDSLVPSQVIFDSIARLANSPEGLNAMFQAATESSSAREPVTFSVPPPPLDSPSPLDATKEGNVAKHELPFGSGIEIEKRLDIEKAKLKTLKSRTSGIKDLELRNALMRRVLEDQDLFPSKQPTGDTLVPSTPTKHHRSEDDDIPSPVTFSPSALLPSASIVPVNLMRARYVSHHGRAPSIDMPTDGDPWPDLPSWFDEHDDSPFDKVFGHASRWALPQDLVIADGSSTNESEVQAVPPSTVSPESNAVGETTHSEVEQESMEIATHDQKPETDENLLRDGKPEIELEDCRDDDNPTNVVHRPTTTPNRERQRARVHSSANSDPDQSAWADVGDATFETTQIFTPFTLDHEESFASPGWTDVPRDSITPPSPSLKPAGDDSGLALLASAAINEDRPIRQGHSAPESPTIHLAPMSTPAAQLAGLLEPELIGDVLETETADITGTGASAGPAVYVPYDELFIDRSGNIMERRTAEARVAKNLSTSADPFLIIDHSGHGDTDDEVLSPDSFVQVSPAAGAVIQEQPVSSISYVLVPSPNAGIESNASESQRPVFVPRPLAPVLEEDEEEYGENEELEEDLFGLTASTTRETMGYSPGATSFPIPLSSEAGPSRSKIAAATGGRKFLDEFPISAARSSAYGNPELADPLAIVAHSEVGAGGPRRKDKGKGKGKASVYFDDEWPVESPSAEDLLYSSPAPAFWPLKPAGLYGRVTPDIIGTVSRHLLENRSFRTLENLGRACQGLGFDDTWVDSGVIRINEPLLDSVTLPSIKTAYRGRTETILQQHDDIFRTSSRLRHITDKCNNAVYASINGLVRFDIRGTVNKPSQPLFPNVLGIAVKSSVFQLVRDNRRLPKKKQLTKNQVNLIIGIVATAFPKPHLLCISPPPFQIWHDHCDLTAQEDDELDAVTKFIRRLMIESKPTTIIFHDLKAGDFCPFPAHCNTIIELGRSPALDSCPRIKSRSRRVSQDDKDKAAFKQRLDHYSFWQYTFEVILQSIERMQADHTVTFRYTDRIFPDKTIPSVHEPPRDFVDRMVLCRFSPSDQSRTKESLAFYMNTNAAETEALYQAQIREFIKKEDREEEYKRLLAHARKVVRIDNPGVWSACPCCFKSGE